jgi:hypothetical protein
MADGILDGEGPSAPPDTGATEMVIKTEGGRVVMRFREPRLWVAFDPSNAVAIGKYLVDCAVQCGAKVTIEVPRREISREKRDALVARATVVFKSMSERGRAPKTIALHVVDSILAAIE